MTVQSCATCRYWEPGPNEPEGSGCCEACEQHYVVTAADDGADCGMWHPPDKDRICRTSLSTADSHMHERRTWDPLDRCWQTYYRICTGCDAWKEKP